jgi:hypothetical protein
MLVGHVTTGDPLAVTKVGVLQSKNNKLDLFDNQPQIAKKLSYRFQLIGAALKCLTLTH